MNLRHQALAPLCALLIAWVCPRPGLAAEANCPGLTLAPDAAFRIHSTQLLERIDDEFRTRVDIDTCARVELSVETDAAGDALIAVFVALPDGRAVLRRVAREEDVLPTLQALLLVPERSAPAENVSSVPLLRPTSSPVSRGMAKNTRARDAVGDVAPADVGARDLGVELSLLTGARFGDGQMGLGLGARSYLELKGWLIGFTGRVDSYRPWQGGDPETAVQLGVLTGARLNFETVALDLTAGLALAIKGLGDSLSDVRAVDEVMMQPPPPPMESSSGPVPRLLVGACLGFTPRSILRTFVGIDAEFGPARVEDGADPASTRLPEYTVGLVLGATVGTR
jgi:hypothetical protein